MENSLGPKGNRGPDDSGIRLGCQCLVCKGSGGASINPLGFLEPVAKEDPCQDHEKVQLFSRVTPYLNTCVTCKHFDELHFECQQILRNIVEVPESTIELPKECHRPSSNMEEDVMSYLEQKICNLQMTLETYQHRDEAKRMLVERENPEDFFKEPLVSGEFSITGFRL